MGDYTGVATRVKVKKTAPAEMINFLDRLYWQYKDESELRDVTKMDFGSEGMAKAIDTLESMLRCASSYFDAWCWRVKEDKGDHWLYESRASCKRPNEKLFKMLLDGIKEHLVLEEGDILLRTIFEDGITETIVCYVNGEFIERDGFEYKTDGGELWDSDHPGSFTTGKLTKEEEKVYSSQRHEDDFEPPWNVNELDALLINVKRLK